MWPKLDQNTDPWTRNIWNFWKSKLMESVGQLQNVNPATWYRCHSDGNLLENPFESFCHFRVRSFEISLLNTVSIPGIGTIGAPYPGPCLAPWFFINSARGLFLLQTIMLRYFWSLIYFQNLGLKIWVTPDFELFSRKIQNLKVVRNVSLL